MKLKSKLFLLVITLPLYLPILLFASDTIYTSLLKQAAIKNQFVKSEDINLPFNNKKADIGKRLFEDTVLSLNGNTSCSSCHVDKFSSADGLPVAFGIGSEGEGVERIVKDGKIVPRNALPLWGRGGKDFNTFFWDGRISLGENNEIISQFHGSPPSDDPLIVAIHLPFVAIREMVADDDFISKNFKNESIESTTNVYDLLIEKLKNDSDYVKELSLIYNIDETKVSFFHVADSIANFIRKKFAIKKTKFEEFVFEDIELSDSEINGGLIFYGKGKCASCHSGKYFSDFDFHSIPFLQTGFGENGFGDDFGRFNMTDNYEDLYKFRTPPLYNVAKTAPYSHSGSYYDLKEVIRGHYDPLKNYDSSKFSDSERVEFFKRIKHSSIAPEKVVHLDEEELEDLVNFLNLLSF